jgi:hypothetical protein
MEGEIVATVCFPERRFPTAPPKNPCPHISPRWLACFSQEFGKTSQTNPNSSQPHISRYRQPLQANRSMMNRSNDQSNFTAVLAAAAPLPLPRQETDDSAALLPPIKPIRQATLHTQAPAAPPSQHSRTEDQSFYSSFHFSFSREDSSGSLAAPSKPVRQVTMATEEQDSFLTLSSSHSSASSEASSSRFNSLFEIVTMENNNEASLTALRFATTPPSQPVRQVTSGVANEQPTFSPPMPLVLLREASGALKKPRVTNCKFSKTSLLDDDEDDEDEDEEQEEAYERTAASKELYEKDDTGDEDARRSKSHRHMSLGMSLSCMTFRTTASGPPPLPVRQISSDGLVVRTRGGPKKVIRGGGDNFAFGVPRVDRLCATESAASASPPARPVRQVSRPMDSPPQLPLPQLQHKQTSRSCSSTTLPPPLPKRQVTQQFVPANADDCNADCQGSKTQPSRSSSRTLTREHSSASREEQVHPPSKPVRQVSIDSFPVPVVALPPLPIAAPRSDARRSRRRSSREHYPSLYEDESKKGRLSARATSAPLTPLPRSKAPIFLASRLMSPSSSSNASSSSSSRSSVVQRQHVDLDRYRQ